ncbi:MAG TPA: UDP-glucose/GDP-mannose dehydrogenase family protein [Armatimonadaceae bacterium]|nr:UDP-glucose/GDP-mannose dehydrogenase family protein [Armatimonadaceae bacterium]
MEICVIGTGYVGLVTGVVFADLGNDVICVDKNEEKIALLKAGVMPIYEPGLEEMVARNFDEGRLTFTTDLEAAVRKSEVVFIAVGTPSREDGGTDMTQVESAARGIAAAMDRYKVVVNKSTVPVGTGDFVRNVIETNRRRNVDFDIVSNPEFLREGSAISDTLYPDRIVIGAPNQIVAMKILELYAPLERPMIITDVASAEMIKYASNAFLATKISFANSIANLCELVGADVVQVVKGMGLDNRIGAAFLQAGLGYGGSCFPKDVSSLLHTSRERGYDFPLLEATIETNVRQAPRFIDKMRTSLGTFENKKVAVLGLAFKANTDDMREAKSLDIIAALLEGGADVVAYDPIAMENTKRIFPHIGYAKNAYDAAEGADAVVVVTEWNEFKQINLDRLKETMQGVHVFDGRNLYDVAKMKRLGFEYVCVGRGCAPENGTAKQPAARPADKVAAK